MIIVKNTKELEERYNLNSIPDNETIRVIGGMENKAKYDNEIYIRRTTYSARQLKHIIQQMKDIEDTIPEDWNQWQRAKYIYQVLGKNIEYNYDEASYSNQQSSNLTILMSGKGICAGYSLLYKEMMDRQGIECDYLRGVADIGSEREKHAWNVLTINGMKFPVDLTWDSSRLRSGAQQLSFFGNNQSFLKQHIQDSDERTCDLYLLSDETVNSINISNTKTKEELDENEKLGIVKLAIEETYKKFANMYDEEAGRRQVTEAIKRYINNGDLRCFTRQGNARQSIEKYFRSEDMLDILVNQYIKQCESREEGSIDILKDAVKQNIYRYNDKQAQTALKSYILSGYTRIFYETK
ncbi:MAG: hypothetical protein IJE68_01570 [Clostridia bacterium]|nr:hypothetical protein [Clostridia bacterium]